MTEREEGEPRDPARAEGGERQTVLDHMLAPLFGVRTEYRLAVSVLETIIESLDVLLASLRPGEVREPPGARAGYAGVSLQVRGSEPEQILRFLDRLRETEAVERVIVSSMEGNRASVVVLLGPEPQAQEESPGPTVVCARCSKVIARGGPQVSHGLCNECADDLLRGRGHGPGP